MALGYRNPISESLSEVGQNIRALSGDILTRKRLDLLGQQQVAEAERERGLTALKAQAQETAGQVELLKTKGSLSELGQQMRLRESAEQRAQASHGLEMRTGEFQLRRGETLLPGEVAEQKANVVLKGAQSVAARASAGASSEQAALTRQRRQQEAAVGQVLDRPLTDAEVAGTTAAIYGPAGLELLPHIAKPGTVKTLRQLMSLNEVFGVGGDDNMTKLQINRATEGLAQLPKGSQEWNALNEHRTRLLESMGKSIAKGTIKTEDLAVEGMYRATRELDLMSRDPNASPERTKSVWENFKMAANGFAVTDPEKQQQAMTIIQGSNIPLIQEFRRLAMAELMADLTREGNPDPQGEAQKRLLDRMDRLIMRYGTPQNMLRMQQEDAAAAAEQRRQAQEAGRPKQRAPYELAPGEVPGVAPGTIIQGVVPR
jgi:hypothetical protein